jgi:hypothetical protein
VVMDRPDRINPHWSMDFVSDCYLDEGIQLLELVQHAVDTYKVLVLSDRGSFLKLVHSSSFWKDGMLTVEYRQQFDFIAKINNEYKQKMAVSREKNDHCLIWLPLSHQLRTFFEDPPFDIIEYLRRDKNFQGTWHIT